MVAVPRRLVVRASEGSSDLFPPMLANSVPKSGTHLLLQILSSLPGSRTWGLFLASQPSFTYRTTDSKVIARKIRGMADRELAGAHLHWNEPTQGAITERPVIHFFIYRDPRDVVVSEAYYLAEMNRWHRLHGYFRSIPDLQSRIRLSVRGLDSTQGPDYPDISVRYGRFLGWLEADGVCSVCYEDLMSSDRRKVVTRVVRHWMAFQQDSFCIDSLVERALAAIKPEQSHTFRRGGAGGWRDVMNEETKACFVRTAEPLVARLGYKETD